MLVAGPVRKGSANCSGSSSTMYHGETLHSISHLAGAVMALMGLGALLAVVFLHHG